MADANQLSGTEVAAGTSTRARDDAGPIDRVPPASPSIGGPTPGPRRRRRRIAGALLRSLLAGLSTGSSVPATLSYISEATVGRPSLRARVMGMFEITLVGGIAMGAVVGGYLWQFLGSAPRTVMGIKLLSPAFSIDALIFM